MKHEPQIFSDELYLETAPTVVTSPPSGPEIDFWKLAMRYKWLVLAGIVGGLLLGQLAYLKLGPMYKAQTKVLVSKKAAVPLKEDSEAKTYGERGEHIALIMSPMIVDKAVKMHQLDDLPSLSEADEPTEDILDNLRVERSAGHDRSFLNVLDIAYENPREDDAKRIAEAVVDAYRSYLTETRQTHTQEAMELISEANEDLLRKLREKEKAYLEFRENAPLHWEQPPGAEGYSSGATNTHQERIRAIETEMQKNILKRAELNSKIKALENALARGDSRESLALLVRQFLSLQREGETAMADGPTAQADLEAKLLPLIIEEKRLLRDFGPDHPDVQAVRKSIETIVQFYRQQGVTIPDNLKTEPGDSVSPKSPQNGEIDFVAVYLHSLKQQLAELEHREKELKAVYEKESKLAKKFSRYQAEDQALSEEVQRVKSLWEAVVGRLNELKLVKNNSGYELKQIAPVQAELVAKRHLKFLGGGLFLVLSLAVGIAYLRELMDTTLKTLDEIRHRFQLPVLGGVPDIEEIENIPNHKSEAGLHPLLYSLNHPGSSEAEAFRSVWTALGVSIRSHNAKVVEISSPEPNDGKTTLAANLAIAAARSGKKVLLVDADLRRPTLHQIFNVRKEIGLAEILEGEIDFPVALQETVIERLSVLSVGTSPASPAELLFSSRLQQFLSDVKTEFDLVLIDTPPLLAVSDPCIIAPQTDGLVLVLRMSKNRRIAVQRAMELLQNQDARILGTVGTAVERSVEAGFSYGAGYTEYLEGAEETPGAETGPTSPQSRKNPRTPTPLG